MTAVAYAAPVLLSPEPCHHETDRCAGPVRLCYGDCPVGHESARWMCAAHAGGEVVCWTCLVETGGRVVLVAVVPDGDSPR